MRSHRPRLARPSFQCDTTAICSMWLLMCSGVPELGLVASTLLLTPWLDVDALNTTTSDQLARSKCSRAFILPIIGLECVLYCWTAKDGWQKASYQDDPDSRGPRSWDVLNLDSEWLND